MVTVSFLPSGGAFRPALGRVPPQSGWSGFRAIFVLLRVPSDYLPYRFGVPAGRAPLRGDIEPLQLICDTLVSHLLAPEMQSKRDGAEFRLVFDEPTILDAGAKWRSANPDSFFHPMA